MKQRSGDYAPCETCGRIIYRTASQPRRFCSRSCARTASNLTTANPAKRKTDHRLTQPCAQCGREFRSYPSQKKRYCSLSCATRARNLTQSNPAHTRDVSGERNPMFGRRSGVADQGRFPTGRREQSPRWKGGRKVRADGYVLVIGPDDHPHPAERVTASGLTYVLEHRLIMEQHLGRYLTPREVVHHRDGNPSNNSLENLELFGSQQEHIRRRHGSGL